ncbi:MAG: hypothetical protein U0807_15190 [Candidatus Binatia bacterium]
MADDDKPPTVVTPPPATTRVASSGSSVVVTPTDTGSVGTQTPGVTTALTVVPPPTQGAVLESPWLTLFEKAGRHASTLAMADVALALTTQHAVEAERLDAADRRKDELIHGLSGQLGDERVKNAKLETERETGASPTLVICGTSLIGIASILATAIPTATAFVSVLVVLAVVQIGLGLWRPKGWRR